MLGDGKKGFFENKFFNFARGPEGEALASADRAAEAVADAEIRADRVGLNDDDLDELEPSADNTVGAVTQVDGRGGSKTQGLRDNGSRAALKKAKQAIKKLRDQNERMIRRMARMEQIVGGHESIRQDMGMGLDAISEVIADAVQGINASDVPTYPMGLQVAAGIRVIGRVAGIGSSSVAYVMSLLASLATIWAYYDPKDGFASLFTVQSSRRRRQVLTETETTAAVDAPKTAPY